MAEWVTCAGDAAEARLVLSAVREPAIYEEAIERFNELEEELESLDALLRCASAKRLATAAGTLSRTWRGSGTPRTCWTDRLRFARSWWRGSQPENERECLVD
jgi:hypothetical protein